MVRTMRNHEAAHAVVAIHLGVPFNTITHQKVKLPLSAASLPGYKIAIAAGCLGEFYEIWNNCLKGNDLNRQLGKPVKACPTPIEAALSKFSKDTYPDDFKAFTIEQSFDQAEYEKCLEAAWPIIVQRWKDILTISSQLGDKAL